MSELLKAGPGQEVVYATQHFQVRVDDMGKGLLELRDVNDMILDGYIPEESARMAVLAAETGYHQGLRYALRALVTHAEHLERELLGPISTPRGELRESTE